MYAREAQRVKEATEEFTRITKTEDKRVQHVATLENERIMQNRKANETEKACPVCRDDIQTIISHEKRKRGTQEISMLCCNARVCHMCTAQSEEFMRKNGRCFTCNQLLHNGTYWANAIKTNDQRHWLLSVIGIQYINGTQGLEKNIKKGLELIVVSTE